MTKQTKQINRWMNEWINKSETGPVTTVQCQVALVNFSAAGLFFLLLHAAPQPSNKWITHNLCGKWLPGNELKPLDQRRFAGGVRSFYVDSSQTKQIFAFWTYSFINVGVKNETMLREFLKVFVFSIWCHAEWSQRIKTASLRKHQGNRSVVLMMYLVIFNTIPHC